MHQWPALADNYIWVVVDHASTTVAVIDPGDASAVARGCRQHGLTPTHILNTHHHWDHTDGNRALKERFGCRVLGAAQDAHRLPVLDEELAPGPLRLGTLPCSVLSLPGHTSGHIGFLIGDALFCGDVLFGAGCGKLFEGTPAQMWDSLQRIAALPPATRIYTAHEYTRYNLPFAVQVDGDNPELGKRILETEHLLAAGQPTAPTTLELELTTNPFLRPLDPDFCRRYAARHRLPAEPLAVFTHLRTARDRK